MEWLAANMGTIIAALVLAVLIFFLVRSTLRSRKNGCGSCSGCGGCSGCRTSKTEPERGKCK